MKVQLVDLWSLVGDRTVFPGPRWLTLHSCFQADKVEEEGRGREETVCLVFVFVRWPNSELASG